MQSPSSPIINDVVEPSLIGAGVGPIENIGEILIPLLLAMGLGGLVGVERELSRKAAGLRTNILICVGAAAFTLVSREFGRVGETVDISRVAAQIVTGIGFLGAGSIIQARGEIHGMTTAATIWVVAAIGLAAGAEYYSLAVVTTGLVILALLIMGWLETAIARKWERRRYDVTLTNAPGALEKVRKVVRDSGLDAQMTEIVKDGENPCLAFEVSATESGHDRLAETLTPLPEVRKIRYS